MGAAYGPQGIVSGRPGSPGWPRKAALTLNSNTADFPAMVLFVRSDQIIKLPEWCTYVRMGATGKGGDGAHAGTSAPAASGGGGGFAGTNTIRAPFGGVINVTFDAVGTNVNAFGYSLIGGNGAPANLNTAGAGGVGSGGDVNFNGGSGVAGVSSSSLGGGGGAAGRGGNGSAGAQNIGGTGAPGAGFQTGAAGGGARTTAGNVGASTPRLGAILSVGLPGAVGTSSAGGDGGGGGGGNTDSAGPRNGGAGFALIELW